MAERIALVVIGMHRSGTSAMARTLSLAGASLPRNLMGAGIGNDEGHWEPQRIADYNDTVLAAFDKKWDSPFGLGMSVERREILDDFVEGARDLIREEYEDAQMIVLKEPRIALIADLWIAALEAEHFTCKFVIMVRPPTEVAASLRFRDGFSLDKGLMLWSCYLASSDLLTRGHARVFCRYDDLLMRPTSVLDQIEEILSIQLKRRTSKSAEDIQSFVNPAKKHNEEASIVRIPPHLHQIEMMRNHVSELISGLQPLVDFSQQIQDWFSNLDTILFALLNDGASTNPNIGLLNDQSVDHDEVNLLRSQNLHSIATIAMLKAEIEGLNAQAV